jgi:uncharacterized protein Yka (UPF0111/DUF47 family)
VGRLASGRLLIMDNVQLALNRLRDYLAHLERMEKIIDTMKYAAKTPDQREGTKMADQTNQNALREIRKCISLLEAA